ncbi:MAG: rhodanese-like domain-containing protein [Yoonia sp.]|nr:rhodanese-like domain-containing protein [Yoonia sp.]
MLSHKISGALAISIGLSTSVIAQATDDALNVGFSVGGVKQSFEQSETVDTAQVASHFRTRTSCNGPCLAPLSVASNVPTIGEREVISFVATQVAIGKGLLIDSRNINDRGTGFISTSVNIPSALLQSDNPFLNDILQAMGAREFQGALNFTDALPLVVFDDGPSTLDAPDLITTLLNLGYPADKISYYRGGMLVWTALGLNTQDAKS